MTYYIPNQVDDYGYRKDREREGTKHLNRTGKALSRYQNHLRLNREYRARRRERVLARRRELYWQDVEANRAKQNEYYRNLRQRNKEGKNG